MGAARWVAATGLIIGLGGVLLNLVIALPASVQNGYSLTGAIIRFFSFYTILTNLTLVLVYLSELVNWRWLGVFRQSQTRAMMAGVMILVMVFYHVLLSGLWSPTGGLKVADTTLHYITPILFGFWWITFNRKHDLSWSMIPAMLVPSLVYLIYAMGRGAIVGEYPYPILEATRIGYPTVAVNVLAVMVGLSALFAITIALDKHLPGSPRNTE